MVTSSGSKLLVSLNLASHCIDVKINLLKQKIMSKNSILTTKAINRLLPVQNCLVVRKSTSHRGFKSRLTRGRSHLGTTLVHIWTKRQNKIVITFEIWSNVSTKSFCVALANGQAYVPTQTKSVSQSLKKRRKVND